MTDNQTFQERVDEFKADTPARMERRATRSRSQKMTDALIGYGALIVVCALIALGIVMFGVLVVVTFPYAELALAGVFLLLFVREAGR